VKNNIYGQCKKMAELIRKGKYTNTTIDPHFKKGLEEFDIFMKIIPGEYSHENIISITISEKAS
jgi:hypothetical protein